MQVGIHTKLTVTIMSFSCYHCEMNLYQSVNYQRLIQWYIQPHTGTGSYLTLITITGDTVTGIVSRKEVRKTAPAQVSTGARLDWAWLATPQHQRHTRAAASVGTSDSGLGGGGLPNVITGEDFLIISHRTKLFLTVSLIIEGPCHKLVHAFSTSIFKYLFSYFWLH